MQINAYDIAEENDKDSLIFAVQKLIKEGWQPLGGVATIEYEYQPEPNCIDLYYRYTQAMVKYDS